MADTSLKRGLNDFFFVQSDSSDVTYNYYGYQDVDGITVIQRTNKAETQFEYWAGKGSSFATFWAARATLSYTEANDMQDL